MRYRQTKAITAAPSPMAMDHSDEMGTIKRLVNTKNTAPKEIPIAKEYTIDFRTVMSVSRLLNLLNPIFTFLSDTTVPKMLCQPETKKPKVL